MDYLHRGLLALSRAHHANAMAGHLGAPLVAVELLLAEHPDLPEAVVDGLHGELDRLMHGDESWFNPGAAGIDVAAIFAGAKIDAEPVSVAPLPEALAASIDGLRESGHNVIFAALALRGLAQRPELVTAEVVDGVRRLLDKFVNAGPGRVYVGAEESVRPDALPLADDAGPYADELDMVHRTLDVLANHVLERRRGLGDLHHVINHAAALVDLRRLGYQDLAARGLATHREHVRRWLGLPVLTAELGERSLSPADPLTPKYWAADELERGSALLSHRPKTIYGFEVLAATATDPQRVTAGRNALRYLL